MIEDTLKRLRRLLGDDISVHISVTEQGIIIRELVTAFGAADDGLSVDDDAADPVPEVTIKERATYFG